jgi:hypothetical protein
MGLPKCNDPRWRRLILALAALTVLALALFLYLIGLHLRVGLLYLFAVTILFCFALAGALALGLLIYALFRRWCELRGAPPKGQGTREKTGPSSAHLPSTIYKKPDPLIYSQSFLMAQGLAVTWDNPDIWLTELPASDGSMAPVASSSLAANHLYRIHALIHNGSLEAPVVGMPVEFSFLTFGIGMVSTAIGTMAVNLAVKGAIGEPTEAFQDWETPAVPGHYCVQVHLVWPDDAELRNNLGQENVDVKKLNSPKATFQFPLRNDAAVVRHFQLEVNAYPRPVPPDCPEPAGPGRPRERDRLAAHRHGSHPLPETWSVQLAPAAEFTLRPGEQTNVVATVNVPETLAEPRPINIDAFADGTLAGGVTLYVHS